MSAIADQRGVEIPLGVRSLIERERLRLMRVASLLACLRAATLYDEEVNAADVAEIAASLVTSAVDALDTVNLNRAINAVTTDDAGDTPAEA